MYPRPHRLIASAVFSGSCGSKGGGARDVLTEQNLQPRVHVSPMSYGRRQHRSEACVESQVERHTMIVAVAALRPSASLTPSLPPQQSPMFGHRASSHTVCRFRPRRSFLSLAKEAPVGMLVLRYDGSLGLQSLSVRFTFSSIVVRRTHALVFPNTIRSETLSAMKSSSEGPWARV